MIHLHAHTVFSVADAVSSSKDLFKQMPKGGVLAITDHDNMSGIVDHFNAAKYADCKAIAGVELTINYGQMMKGHITLLAENNDGLQSLYRLMTSNKTYDDLHAYRRGLICMTGDISNPVATNYLMGREAEAKAELGKLRDIFGENLYLELIDHGIREQKVYNEWIQRSGINHVYTNDIHYATKGGEVSQVFLMCDSKGVRLTDSQIGFKWINEAYVKDIPINQHMIDIADRCNVKIGFDSHLLPKFETPDGSSVDDYLKEMARKGLVKKGKRNNPIYVQRAKFELEVIKSMDFSGYFLIVQDYVNWARNNGVEVGPGRGSGVGSIIAYLIGITNIDPIPHDLLFERFLNPERVSMPDFDVDFDKEGRPRVINYLINRYGRDKVASIANFSELSCRSAFKSAARVCGIAPSKQNIFSSMLPKNVGDKELLSDLFDESGRPKNPANDALDQPDMYNAIKYGIGIEGAFKSIGKHASGFLILDRPINECMPAWEIKRSSLNPTPFDGSGDNNTQFVSQIEHTSAEKQFKVVKFDILGLTELLVISYARKLIAEQGMTPPNFDDDSVDRDDPATWALVARGETIGVFQLSSDGMAMFSRDRLRPDRFDDCVALTALYRPGPKDAKMHDEYADRKHGISPVTYLHPLMEPALKKTFGIIVYQEQVMKIAQVIAGYTLGGADLLRRAMGKKDSEEMDRQKAIFLSGSIKNGVDEVIANKIWDEVKTFARYGFNLSHSVAYTDITFQTAYLKAHFPAELLAAQMQARHEDSSEVAVFVREAKRMNIPVEEVNVLNASWRFRVRDGVIRMGMCGLKGISEKFAREVESGAPKNITELFSLVSISKTDYEVFVHSGALDDILPAGMPFQVRCDAASQFKRLKKTPGQIDMFYGMDQVIKGVTKGYSEREVLDKEFQATGRYISGHPTSIYRGHARRIGAVNVSDMEVDSTYNCVLLMMGVREFESKSGEKMAFLSMEDATGAIDITAFPSYYQDNRGSLKEGEVYSCLIKTSLYEDRFSASIVEMKRLE